MRCDTESGTRELNPFSRNLEVGLTTAIRRAFASAMPSTCWPTGGGSVFVPPRRQGRLPGQLSRHLEAARDSLTDGCAADILGEGTGGSGRIRRSRV